MAKIFFWSSGKTDACTFYRMAEPARVLRTLGHDATQDYQVGLATLMTSDVVVIQRPTEANATHLMDKLLALPEGRRPRIVVELDDDLFSLPEHHPVKLGDAQRHRLTEAIRRADRVTVTNEHLARVLAIHAAYEDDTEAQAFGHDAVRVVPNYVPERFVVDFVPPLGISGTPTITWAGSDTHRRDFDEVAVALRKLLRERDDFQVRIVGAPYAARLKTALGADLDGRGGFRVTQVPWVEGVARYIPTLAGHIGLAPLADDLFNRSKSDLRLKELAARGMAIYASPVGPYRASDIPGVQFTNEWAADLEHVLERPDWRWELASLALTWAQSNTLEAHAVEWEKALLD